MIHWPYHDETEVKAVAKVLRSGLTNYWSEGSHGQLFEQEFAAYTGASYALTVTNGTAALELALFGLGLNELDPSQDHTGWEIIVPCRTFMATASAVVTAGCVPVLADINPDTLNVDVKMLEARRTPRTVAVIVVHYAGFPCDMESILFWAKKYNIIVIEDCAHAHGARIKGQHVGTFGHVGCFSFCVGKIMSTGGEGGMVITNDEGVHKRMGARRDHGRYQIMGSKDLTQFKWGVEEFGTNLRMTEMQSVIGRIQLTKLDGWVNRRNDIAAEYDAIFQKINGRKPLQVRKGFIHARYMHMTVTDDRDRRLKALQDMDIPARLGGCPNIGHEPVFHGTAAPCPQADEVGRWTLSLPVYPTMTDVDVDNVLKAVEEVCA